MDTDDADDQTGERTNFRAASASVTRLRQKPMAVVAGIGDAGFESAFAQSRDHRSRLQAFKSKELASCLASSRLLCNSFNCLTHSLKASAEGTALASALASAEVASAKVSASHSASGVV